MRVKASDRRSTTSKMGEWTRKRLRKLILARPDGNRCVLCSGIIDVELKWPDPKCFTIEHHVPRSEGGTDDPDNLGGAHKVCNESRGNKTR